MISIKLMKDSAVISLLMFSVVSDSCLSCAGRALPRSQEEQVNIEYSTTEDECNLPTNCAAWVDCQLTCEQIYWDDVESNDSLSDEAGIDDFRELCVQYCDRQYVTDETEQTSVNSCSQESCSACGCLDDCTCAICDVHSEIHLPNQSLDD